MITARRSIVDFDRKYDRFVGQANRRLRQEDKLAVINEALEIYFENRVKVAETDSKVRDDLRVLEMKEVKIPLVISEENFNVYEIPAESYRVLRKRVVASKEDCGEKDIPLIMFQTDDIDNARNSPYWRSSFQWEHAISDEGSKGLYVWHEGDFKIVKTIIDYYRKPKEIHAPSMTSEKKYEDWNGIIREKDQGLELTDTYSHRKIIDIAVLIARANVGDVRDFDIQLNKILNVEKINN